MSGTVQEVSDVIRDIVATNGQIPGSRLSAALKERVSGWAPSEFGVRSLREFVAAHVTGVAEVARSGMDVIYGLAGAARLPVATSEPVPASEPDFWRIWVSPNSPFALIVDRATGEMLAARRENVPVAEGQVLLQPPGVELHQAVAREFLEKVPEELRRRLRTSLDQSSGWWQAWLRELRGSAQHVAWNSFRRDAFEHQLRSQLASAAVSDAQIARVLAKVRHHHLEGSPRARHTKSAAVASTTIETDSLRRLVIEAVGRMSSAELRDLRLPLGVVLDVLESPKPR